MLFTFLAAQGHGGREVAARGGSARHRPRVPLAGAGARRHDRPADRRRRGLRVRGRCLPRDRRGDAIESSSFGTDGIGLDIGPETASRFAAAVSGSKTVFWNGPMGRVRVPGVRGGTKTVAQALTEVDGLGVVGGGDSAAAVRSLGFSDDQFGHISTVAVRASSSSRASRCPVSKHWGGRDEPAPLIAGNWKMNLDHLQAIATVQKLAWTLKDARHDHDDVEVAVFPPFTDLRSVQTLISADKLPIRFGCRTSRSTTPVPTPVTSRERSSPPWTRSTSSSATPSGGRCTARPTRSWRPDGRGGQARTRAGRLRRRDGEQREERGAGVVAVEQLQVVLDAVQPAEIVVAYEPVWAIGSGQAATADQAQEECAAIRRGIAAAWGTRPLRRPVSSTAAR